MRESRRLILRFLAGVGAATVLGGCASPSLAPPTATVLAPFPPPTATNPPVATATTVSLEASSSPIPTLTPEASSLAPGPGRLVGYLASWNVGATYPISSVPADKLSHLNYAFATISDGGELILAANKNHLANVAELVKLRQKQPSLRLLISVGGAGTAKGFSPLAGAVESRQRFAQSCVAFIKKIGFDGVDVDWEFPTGRDEGKLFTQLLAELRRQLDDQAPTNGDRYLLTVAAPAGPSHYLDLELDQIGRYVDWINLMTYAFHGTWSTTTNFDAPLFASSTDPSPTLLRVTYNTDAAVQAYLAAGIPADKIVVGVPFYGYGWKGVPDVNHGLYQTPNGVPPGTLAPGVFTYRDLAANYTQSFSRYWHDEAQVPWLFNAPAGIMISYDDPTSVGGKADYVRSRRLGGAMIWELSIDDLSHSLTTALYTHLVAGRPGSAGREHLIMLALGREDILRAVTIADAIDAARVAFVALSTGAATVPPRPHLSTTDGTVLVMPAYSSSVGAVGVKVVSVTPENASRCLPTVQGLVVLVDARTGRPTALLDGTFLTQLRTGAAIGLAADVLARKDAATVALFGVGATARTSLWAICAARPIRDVRVVHPHAENFPIFASEMAALLGDAGPSLRRVESANQAVDGADIVITATSATSPVFSGAALRAGTFVGALGAYRPTDRELDEKTVRDSRLVVDTRAGALSEAGDIVIPIAQGRLRPEDIWAELGEILAGTRPGRARSDENFVFKSVGNAMQDLALASRVYERALALGLGTSLSL